MIYKNGLKERLLMLVYTTVFFGLFMGLYFGIICGDFKLGLLAGIISGVLFGVFFTGAMSIFADMVEKKAEKLRVKMYKERKVICEGPANHKKGINGISGWLFLTKDALEFYPHKVNAGSSNIVIFIDDILYIDTNVNQLIIQTKWGKFQFVVNKANLWKNSITQICN